MCKNTKNNTLSNNIINQKRKNYGQVINNANHRWIPLP